MKTQAIVFEDVERVRLRQIELPEPTDDDVVVRTLLSAVSVGTERWTYIGKRAEIYFPNVPGYMGVGVIESAGARAREFGYVEGGMIYFGRSRMCGEFADRSWMSTHMAEAVVDVVSPRANPDFFSVEPVAAGTSPEDISLAALCAVSLRGIEMAVVPAASRVLVCGLGILGQYAAQVCRLKGALVCACDVVEERCHIAAELGVERVVNSKREGLAQVAADFAPEGFDIIIDTSSVAAVVNSLWPLLKMRGKMVFQGWYPPPTGLDLNAAHMRMPSAYFPCAHSSPAVASALRWMREGRINTRRLVSHHCKPAEAPEIYNMLKNGSEDFLGIVFDWR